MKCPDPELLAATAEGLDRPDGDSVLDHAADCDDCRHALLVLQTGSPAPAEAHAPARPRYTVRTRVATRSPFPWAVAALLLLSVAGLVVLAGRLNRRADPPEPGSAPIAEIPVKRESPPAPPPPRDPPPFEPRNTEEPGKENRPTPKRVEDPPRNEIERAPVNPVAPPVRPEPARPAPLKPVTISVVAILDRVDGEVFVLAGRDLGREKLRARAGVEIKPGEGLECVGARSFALVSFADKTRIELGGDTLVREMLNAKGKRVFIEKGTVKAEIAKQPKDQPMIFDTPHGEAKVVGTVLRLVVEPDPKKGTSLEVEEGKVELVNAVGRTVEVAAGHGAVAATGVPLAAKLYPREEVLFALDFEDGKRPLVVDNGTVERGPGNRLCLAGEPDPSGSCKLFFGDGTNGLLTFMGDEVLSFDYWTDPQASQVNFNFWDRTQGRSHEGQVAKVVVGKWTHVTFKLADLGDPGTRLKEGDWVAGLYMQSTGPAPRKFYIDNLQIVRTRALKPRPAEMKK
jgi:hypothetical protein